jgi:serine/threonine protein kinase
LAEPHPEEFTGTDRFQVRRGLGTGGFGAVYEVFDRDTGALLALKVLKRGDGPSLYRFKREFRALADVTHPNLVALYELVSEGGRWFFTMELVDGVDFLTYVWGAVGHAGAPGPAGTTHQAPPPGARSTVKQAAPTMIAPVPDVAALDTSGRPGEPVPPRTAPVAPRFEPLREALAQLTTGILALHEAGKLHCDIKPLNVRVTPEGRVVLLDFGLVNEGAAQPSPHDGGIVGTVPYMSPEQAMNQPMIEASDWYSLGAMLYEALTGSVPFRGPVTDVLRAKQQSEPPAPSKMAAGTPPDLDEICRGLLRRDPAHRLGGRDILARLGRETTSAPAAEAGAVPLVGRERHLRRLDQAFSVACGGRPAVAHVRGPSGMGKTALVRRFLERLRERGPVVVLGGRCFERESVPYKALDSLVDALAHHLRALPEDQARSLVPREAAALARLFPVLSQVPGIATGDQGGEAAQSQELRRRGVTALRALVGRLARQVPLVLTIDDLQWGDVDSAVLLAELLAPPDPAPALFVAAYRHGGPEGDGPFLRTFRALLDRSRAATHVETVDIAELTPPEGEALARALVRDTTGGVPETIAREAGGNALFITELARHWKGSGVLGPITLEGMIHARVGRLPPEARRLLEVIAVAAQPLLVEVAGAAAQLSAAEHPALAQLRAAHLVRLQGASPRLEAAHDRIREVVVGALGPDDLREYHRRLALALETSGRADAEALAVHFQGAGDISRAAAFAMAAAAQSSRALAFDRAARLYRLALELRGPDAADDHRLRVDLAGALANAGRGGEAAEAYLAAAAVAAEPAALDLRRQAAEQFLRSGHIDRGLDAIRAVLRSLGMSLARTPRRALASLVLRRAWLRLRGLGYREREASDVPADELIRIDACWSVAVGLSLVDNVRSADFQARHLLRALRAGEPYRIARALAVAAGHSAAGGTQAQPRTQWLVAEAARLADRLHHPHALGLAALMAGLTACLEGRFRTGLERADEAARILRERCTGVAWELDTAHSYALLSLTYLGELGEVARRLPALLQDADDRGDLFGSIRLRTRLLGVALLAADDPERAMSEVERVIARWSHQAFGVAHYNALWAVATIALYAGDASGGRKMLAERWRALSDSLTLRAQLARVEVLLLRARCVLGLAAQGGGEELLAEAARDVRRVRREATPWGGALATLVEAGLAATRGDRSRALALVDAAESGCDAAQMGLCAAAARRRRGELLGGEAGQALVEAADEWMRQRDIRNPARMTALLAPGRWT